MLSEFFGRFCRKRRMEASALEERGPALSQYWTLGAGSYRHREVAEVIFTNNIKRTIIDNDGCICDFPGFDISEEDKRRLERSLEDGKLPVPVVHFRTEFYSRKSDDRFLMIWEVQPDGRYWEDEDGFGGTSDPEVRLYSHIDELGRFTEPFRIYNIGAEKFYHE